MPTELADATGDLIRERAWEYGTTTGRPRRCGWFDGVAATFSGRLNGFTSIALTRLDVLDTLPVLQVCTKYEVGGKTATAFPASVAALEKCRPIYEEFPGWQTETSSVREYGELPAPARRYISRLESLIGAPVNLISVGPARDQTIVRGR
jgi:adenylosuccinate synthase